MKARRSLVLSVAAGVASMLVVSTAAAKPGYFVFPAYRTTELTVKGSHGYTLHAEQLRRGGAYLLASRRQDAVGYFLPHARAQFGEIRAHFPGVGRIAVSFHPRSTYRERVFPGCTGEATTIQKGVFTGTIELQGENGFTAVHATHAKGEVVEAGREVCKRSGDHGEAFDGNTLFAVARRGSSTVAVSATEFPTRSIIEPSDLFFRAFLWRRRAGMYIQNLAFAHTKKPSAFAVDEGIWPASATIAPPSPFVGTASFGREADGSLSFTGNLTAELPGIGRVTLAGPRFKPVLCTDDRHCQGRSKSSSLRRSFFARPRSGFEAGRSMPGFNTLRR